MKKRIVYLSKRSWEIDNLSPTFQLKFMHLNMTLHASTDFFSMLEYGSHRFIKFKDTLTFVHREINN